MAGLKQYAETLAAILETLTRANESGIIKDTIWHGDHETLFDFIESERAALAAVEPSREPLFYVRLCSGGGYEGPIHASSIEHVRVASGAWKPLYLAAPSAPVVPDGWRLVPVKPTPEMLAAFKRAYKEGSFWNERMHRALAEMLAAAPTPTGEQR